MMMMIFATLRVNFVDFSLKTLRVSNHSKSLSQKDKQKKRSTYEIV